MDTLPQIRDATLRLMRTLGDQHLGRPLQELGWTFRFDRARRRMGSCRVRTGRRPLKEITLSRSLARRNGWAVMEDVARHEIAHAMDRETRGRSDHGPQWKAWARKCGADPTRLYEGDDLEAPPYKYRAVCPNACGYETGFYRMVSRWYYCPECSDEDEKAYLRLTERESGNVVREGGPEERASAARRNFTDPKRKGYKYTAVCPECGHMVGFKRKTKRTYACPPCCTEKSGGRFDSRFALQVRQNW